MTHFGEIAGDHGMLVPQGAKVVPGEESRANAAYGLMPTPDLVPGAELAEDGLIVVAYQATWKESISGNGRAALFVGPNQLKRVLSDQATPQASEVALGVNVSTYKPLVSTGHGLTTGTQSTAYTGDVTTGQALGVFRPLDADAPEAVYFHSGPCYIFAAAGTYDISVQFKASSGSVTAKERKLWVWTMNFARSSTLPPI